MTVYKMQTGRWRYDIRVRRRRLTKAGFETRQAALTAQEFARDAELRGRSPVFSTFNDLVDAYLRASARTKTGEWCYQLELKLSKGFGHLAGLDLAEIKPAHIQEVLNRLHAKGLKPATVNEYRKIVKATFAYGVRMEVMTRNPASATDKVPADAREPDIITTADLKRLILAAEPELASFLLVASQTGARFRELARLKWESVFTTADEPFAVLSTRKKSGGDEHRQPQPLTPVAIRALESQRGRSAVWVWPASRGGEMKYGTQLKRLRRLTAHLEMREYGFHSIRHWAGYQATAMGINRKAVAAFLRHEDSGVTEIYLHAMEPEVWAIARRLEEVVGDGESEAEGKQP